MKIFVITVEDRVVAARGTLIDATKSVQLLQGWHNKPEDPRTWFPLKTSITELDLPDLQCNCDHVSHLE